MITRILTLLAVFSLFATSAMADSATELKLRMDQRLPALDALKSKEAVGENNRGYVEVRQPAVGADSLVAEENKDRGAVYALIAQKAGGSADTVGQARAKQIAAKSPAGIWLQDESGRWYKK